MTALAPRCEVGVARDSTPFQQLRRQRLAGDLYPLAGGGGVPARRIFSRPARAGAAAADRRRRFEISKIPVRGDDGVRAIGATDATEVRGRGADRRDRTSRDGSRRALSPIFRLARSWSLSLGGWWRTNPARRILLLDPPGPALRLPTDVAVFHFSDIPVRGDGWSSGGSGRPTLRRSRGRGADRAGCESCVDWAALTASSRPHARARGGGRRRRHWRRDAR